MDSGEQESDTNHLLFEKRNSVDPLVVSMMRSRYERQKLVDRETEFSQEMMVTVRVATWNVGGAKPVSEIEIGDWLSPRGSEARVFAIGLQEIVELSPGAGFADSDGAASNWRKAFEAALGTSYSCVIEVHLVGLLLCVFADSELSELCSDFRIAKIDHGVVRRNGAVSISLKILDTSFCFVNSHLSPHLEKVALRNQEVADIHRNLSFSSERGDAPLGIMDHDFLFWFGDLNYRVDLQCATALSLLKTHGIAPLLHKDQLSTLRRARSVFTGFQEGAILFEPTYKYSVGTCNYNEGSGRTPSWCDRVLWRGKGVDGEDGVKQLSYSRSECSVSDHRPVAASFEVSARQIDVSKLKIVREQVLRMLDSSENDCIPTISIDMQEIHFKELRFNRSLRASICVRNTGNVFVVFTVQCPSVNGVPWLEIGTDKKMLMPGEHCVINVTARIDGYVTAGLWRLWKESGANEVVELSQILSLVLDEGREHFVSVSASYHRSVFGTDLQTLLTSWPSPRVARHVTFLATVATAAPSLISLGDDGAGGGGDFWQVALRKHHLKGSRGTMTCLRSSLVPEFYQKLVHSLYVSAMDANTRGESVLMGLMEKSDEDSIGQVIDALDEGESVQHLSHRDLGQALLLLLRSLPDPLVPVEMVSAALSVSSISDTEAFDAVLSSLESPNYCFLVFTIALFRALLECSDSADEVDLLAAQLAQSIVRSSPALSAKRPPTKYPDAWEHGSRFIAHLLKKDSQKQI